MDGRTGRRAGQPGSVQVGPLAALSTSNSNSKESRIALEFGVGSFESSVTSPSRIVCARSSRPKSSVRPNVRVATGFPPREPRVSVRLPPAHVEDRVWNKQRDAEPECERYGGPSLHCSAPPGPIDPQDASCSPGSIELPGYRKSFGLASAARIERGYAVHVTSSARSSASTPSERPTATRSPSMKSRSKYGPERRSA